jgi:hypothetical protein
MKTKNCFVISPIGEKDSDIRKHADAFLKLLVEPALSEFGFNIIRADQIATSSIITNDIVEYVQQSELCLVDLTFHNPNVFYECGRRHENGRPTIQLIKEGEILPFDVAGIRTISYNLSTPWTTLESVNTVKDFVKALDMNDAYGEKSSGVSLSTIAQSLSRIEKKLSNQNSTLNFQNESSKMSISELLMMHPSKAFFSAFENGDINSAKIVLKRLKMLPEQNLYFKALKILATVGDIESKNTLLEILDNYKEKTITEKQLITTFSGMKEYYSNTDTEKVGLEELNDIFKYFFSKKIDINDETRAYIYYIKYYLEYSTENYEQALKDGLMANKLTPKDRDYWINLAYCYNKLEQYENSADAIVEYLKLQNMNPEYEFIQENIDFFKDIFSKAERESEISKLLSNYQ